MIFTYNPPEVAKQMPFLRVKIFVQTRNQDVRADTQPSQILSNEKVSSKNC